MYSSVPTIVPAIVPAARPGDRARNAEVGDQGAVFLVEQDVSGLQIAVHDAGFVGRDETGSDLARDPQRARDRQPAFMSRSTWPDRRRGCTAS